MNKWKYDVFISSSSEDRDRVEALKLKLHAAGIRVFTDQEIAPGQNAAEEIRKAIESSRYMVVLVSENSLNSEWANFEIGVALSTVKEEGEIRVLPVIDSDIDQSRLPLPYGHRNFYATDAQDTDRLISQIKASIS